VTVQFLNKSQLASIIGLSAHTFRRYRERGAWLEGVHYVKVNQNTVLYNQAMVLDWLANRGNPAQHQRNVEAYLKSLSHEKPTPTRKARQRQD
jgi:phage terminase Nu1 subunit (DNA packaging protein)